MAEQLSGPRRTHDSAAVNRGIRLQPGTNGSTVARAPEPPEYRLLVDQLRANCDVSEIETYSSHVYASWPQIHTDVMHGSRDIQPNRTDSLMDVDDPSPVSSAAARITPAAVARCSCTQWGK